MTPDETLVARALAGGPESFAPIIDRYKDAVFGVALAKVRNFHDAEDIAQTVFVEAFQKLRNLREAGRLGPWLRTIAINRSINHLTRKPLVVGLEQRVDHLTAVVANLNAVPIDPGLQKIQDARRRAQRILAMA